MGLCMVYCGNIVRAYAWSIVVWAYAWSIVEILYGLMRGLLWKYCMGLCVVYCGNIVWAYARFILCIDLIYGRKFYHLVKMNQRVITFTITYMYENKLQYLIHNPCHKAVDPISLSMLDF